MPEAQTETKEKLVDIPLPEEYKGKTVIRNEVEWPLVDHQLIKGDFRGEHYLGFSITPENLPLFIKFIGPVEAAGLMNTAMKRGAQDIWKGCRVFEVDAEGKQVIIDEKPVQIGFNFDQYLEEIKDPLAAAMKLSEIRSRMDETQAEFLKEAANTENYKPENAPAFQVRMQELTQRMNAYKAQEEKRSKSRKKDEEAEAAVVA